MPAVTIRQCRVGQSKLRAILNAQAGPSGTGGLQRQHDRAGQAGNTGQGRARLGKAEQGRGDDQADKSQSH